MKSEPQGRWEGTAKFKLWFNNGGAIEFGQCLLNAGRLASEARAAQQFVYTQTTVGNIYPAPPPSYSTLNANSYGWVPMDRFPDRPAGENVYMYDQPPPYAGIFPAPPPTHSFDERSRVASGAETTGYVDPNKSDKMYVVSSAPPHPQDELPPSYSESINKKKD